MSLPLPDLTFYRMPDYSPFTTSSVSLLTAIKNSIRSTVDYRGVTLPSTHLWTETNYITSADVLVNSYYSPTGSGNNRIGITILGTDTVISPTMLSPDTFSTNFMLIGLSKDITSVDDFAGDYLTSPYVSASFSGYSGITPLAARSTATKCRAYISEEAIFINIFTNFTTSYWVYLGAIIEPFNSYDNTKHNYIPCAETDDRIYGITSTGNTAVNGAFYSNTPTLFAHSTIALANHSNIFQPLNNTMLPNIRRRLVASSQYNSNEDKDLSGNYVFDSFQIIRTSLYRIGNSRGIYAYGIPKASQLVIREGTVDKYHVIAQDHSGINATQAFVLKAAP